MHVAYTVSGSYSLSEQVYKCLRVNAQDLGYASVTVILMCMCQATQVQMLLDYEFTLKGDPCGFMHSVTRLSS